MSAKPANSHTLCVNLMPAHKKYQFYSIQTNLEPREGGYSGYF